MNRRAFVLGLLGLSLTGLPEDASARHRNRKRRRRIRGVDGRAFTKGPENCACGSGNVCVGKRGGRYCITPNGGRRYGQ